MGSVSRTWEGCQKKRKYLMVTTRPWLLRYSAVWINACWSMISAEVLPYWDYPPFLLKEEMMRQKMCKLCAPG